MKNGEIEKGVPFVLINSIEYVTDSITSRSILKKASGAIVTTSFDAGKRSAEGTSPFDTLIQVTEGSVKIFIESRAVILAAGEAIVIPAHKRSSMAALNRFKMLSTIIKSGYEDVA